MTTHMNLGLPIGAYIFYCAVPAALLFYTFLSIRKYLRVKRSGLEDIGQMHFRIMLIDIFNSLIGLFIVYLFIFQSNFTSFYFSILTVMSYALRNAFYAYNDPQKLAKRVVQVSIITSSLVIIICIAANALA